MVPFIWHAERSVADKRRSPRLCTLCSDSLRVVLAAGFCRPGGAGKYYWQQFPLLLHVVVLNEVDDIAIELGEPTWSARELHPVGRHVHMHRSPVHVQSSRLAWDLFPDVPLFQVTRLPRVVLGITPLQPERHSAKELAPRNGPNAREAAPHVVMVEVISTYLDDQYYMAVFPKPRRPAKIRRDFDYCAVAEVDAQLRETQVGEALLGVVEDELAARPVEYHVPVLVGPRYPDVA